MAEKTIFAGASLPSCMSGAVKFLCWVIGHRWEFDHYLLVFHGGVNHDNEVYKCTRCGKEDRELRAVL